MEQEFNALKASLPENLCIDTELNKKSEEVIQAVQSLCKMLDRKE